MNMYKHKYYNNDKKKLETHTYVDFEIISEHHGAEGYDSYIRKCKKCGLLVSDSS